MIGQKEEAHITRMWASSKLNDTDPPCSPRGKWSLEGTKVGPGGLDRAGVTTRLTNGSRRTIPEPSVSFTAARCTTPSAPTGGA
ncbi:hypothetical protein GCM10020256_47850 [Streptomyces thermocoprophilus]